MVTFTKEKYEEVILAKNIEIAMLRKSIKEIKMLFLKSRERYINKVRAK